MPPRVGYVNEVRSPYRQALAVSAAIGTARLVGEKVNRDVIDSPGRAARAQGDVIGRWRPNNSPAECCFRPDDREKGAALGLGDGRDI